MAIIYICVRHPFLILWNTVRRKILIPPVHLLWIVVSIFFIFFNPLLKFDCC